MWRAAVAPNAACDRNRLDVGCAGGSVIDVNNLSRWLHVEAFA
jgi:2-polyprenyl-3-methyl-5-hydroxy-6-metoxy-1,4-benzoquinol methylase